MTELYTSERSIGKMRLKKWIAVALTAAMFLSCGAQVLAEADLAALPETSAAVTDEKEPGAGENAATVTIPVTDARNSGEAARSAADFTIEDGVLVKYTGSGGEAEVPSGVTAIGDEAFKDCVNVTRVTLPEGVTEIGNAAFSGCTGLTDISLPAGLTTIGWNAFAGCTGLASVSLPDSVTELGWSAFYGCESLSSVRLSDNIKGFGDGVFANCVSLESITVPKKCASIGELAFAGCTKLAAFDVTKGNEYFHAADGVLYCSDPNALMRCPPARTGSFTVPDGVTEINVCAFSECAGLTSVALPSSLKRIWRSAFQGCTGLASLALPDSLTDIGSSAFDGCANLGSITFGGNETTIESYAFSGCKKLTSAILPDSVDTLELYAFNDCAGLTEVRLPASLGRLEQGLFTGCSSLQAVDIPASVTGIDMDVFHGCAALERITVPDGVTSVGNGAFHGCRALTTAVIPASVTAIGYDLFGECPRLRDVYYLGTQEQWKRLTGSESDANYYVDYLSMPSEAVMHYEETPPSFLIRSHPADVIADAGSDVTFRVVTDGEGLTYQWFFRKEGEKEWSVWENHTSASETFRPDESWDGASFCCEITDSEGRSLRSDAATLTVLSAPDDTFSDELIDLVAGRIWDMSGTAVNVFSYSLNADQDTVDALLDAIGDKYPVEYDVAGVSNWSYSHSGGKLVSLRFLYRESMTQAEFSERVCALNDVADAFCDSLKGQSKFGKIVAAHDFLIEKSHYENTGDGSCRNAYSLLVNHRGVCQAYTAAFRLLMKKMNIPCKAVVSDDMNHTWNLVKYGGNWYHIDVTWDDPVVRTDNECSGYEQYEYFMVNDSEITSLDHHGWKNVETCVSDKFSAMPRGKLSDQSLFNNRWYFIDSENEEIVSTNLYGGDRETVAGNATGGAAVYDGVLYYGSGSGIGRCQLSTGESDMPYVMPAEELGGLPSSLPVKITGIRIDGDGILRYAYQSWVSQGNGSYSSVILDSEAAFSLKGVGFAKDIVLSRDKILMGVGKTQELVAFTSPNSSSGGVVWSISDETVASVSPDGKVTGKKLGKTTVTATLGFFKAECEVNVCVVSGGMEGGTEWELTDNGTLEISGDGPMLDFASASYAPWYPLRDGITSVFVEGGVTHVGHNAFAGLANMTDATISGSVTSIGRSVFAGCYQLSSLTVPFIGSSPDAGGTKEGVLGYFFGESVGAVTQYYKETDGALKGASYAIPAMLRSVTVTEAKVIPFGAFSNASSLKTVTLYPTVEKLDAYSFYKADYITDVYFMGSSARWPLVEKTGSFFPETAQMHYAFTEVYATDVVLTESELTLQPRESHSLTAVLLPIGCTEQVAWNSSDETVAVVTQKGKVTAVGPGTAVITVTTSETEMSAQCAVTVTYGERSFTASAASPQEQQTEITLTATGGAAYKFYSECGGTWKRLQEPSAQNSCLWKPTAAGTYTLYVDIMDGSGNVLECRTMQYVITRTQGELTAVMTAQYASPQPAGTTIRLNVTAAGGAGALRYKFYSECNGVWTKLWDYSDRSWYNWHATTVGTHTVYCDVKDESGRVVCTLFQYRIVAGENFVADLNANRISGQYTGTEIRLLAGSSNGEGEVQYKFYLEKDGLWKRLCDYSAQTYFLWTPTEAGFYNVYVDARDSAGRIASKRLCITIEEGTPLRVTSLTATPASPVAGSPVTLTGTTTGGEGRVTYKFYFERGGAWFRIRDFGESPTCAFTPDRAGVYHIYMDAIDGKKNTQCLMITVTVS